MATEKNFDFVLGDTWEIDFALNDLGDQELDLTGAHVEFVLSLGGVAVLTLSNLDSPVGIALDSPIGGLGDVAVTPADQRNVSPGAYAYVVRATLGDGRVTTQARGKIIVYAE